MEKSRGTVFRLLMRMMANFLALFLLALFIADGEEAEHDIPLRGYFVAEVDYSYVDFPTSLSRTLKSQQTKIQRLFVIPTGIILEKFLSIETSPIVVQHQVSTVHPLLFSLLTLVVSSNAP